MTTFCNMEAGDFDEQLQWNKGTGSLTGEIEKRELGDGPLQGVESSLFH